MATFWQHPDWKKAQQDDDDDEERPGLEYVDLDIINNWVVKLTFEKILDNKTENFTGNGFFVNVPNIKDKHVIFTAAHNVISNGIRTLNLKVIYNNPFSIDPDNPNNIIFADDKKPAIIELPVDNTDDNVHICAAYNLGTGKPSADYAAIRIPRTPGGDRGFGFSLRLADKKTFEGNVHVSGFRAKITKSLRPVTSSAFKLIYHGDDVEYRAKTEQGISGSPVWVEYRGYPTAVAVHNNGVSPKDPKGGSRGALLTAGLLRDVFEWLDPTLLLKGIQIQVRPEELKKKKHPAVANGLFLSFMDNTGFGRVRLNLGTKLDWILAQVDSSNVYYALWAIDEKKWLRFNLAKDKYEGVELSEKMDRRGCLLLKFPVKQWMNFGVETSVKDKRVQLRMEGDRIKMYDAERESSEVSFVEYGGNESTLQFYRFILKAT